MPQELARSLAGQALAPVPAQEPVPEFGLTGHRTLIGTLGRLEDSPADKFRVDEPDPEA